MSRISNREKLLRKGLQVVHERGFGGASVRDIVHAAGVPQGSFTNHFVSKEAFGLEVLERYHEASMALAAATLRNDALAPLARLRAWLDEQAKHLQAKDMRRGCLYGNLSADSSESSEPIRTRVVEAFADNRAAVAYCLKAAVLAGELAPNAQVDELAAFIIPTLQGAILVAKAERRPDAFARAVRVIFERVLPLT